MSDFSPSQHLAQGLTTGRVSAFPDVARRFIYIDANAIRAGCLLLALFLYAFLGSPTPDQPGMVEAIIGGLLILAVGFNGTLRALRVDMRAPLWRSAGQVLLLYGLAAGTLSGVINGHAPGAIVRDVFPFLFMMLPVFCAPLCRAYPAAFKFLLVGVVLIAVIFALRALQDVGSAAFAVFIFLGLVPAGEIPAQGELTYLANAPTLLFSAVFLFGVGLKEVVDKFTLGALVKCCVCLALAALILSPIILTTQRASLGYAGLAASLICVTLLCLRPYRMAAMFLFALVVLFILGASGALSGGLNELTNTFVQKHDLVGFNARFEELHAVWMEISTHPFGVLFGGGWGAMFESPAVGMVRVNFTHSLLSSILLKTGLIGLGVVVAYLYGLARGLLRLMPVMPVFALALAGPIAIDVFLYASFKSLDFGLILLLISAALFYGETMAEDRARFKGGAHCKAA